MMESSFENRFFGANLDSQNLGHRKLKCEELSAHALSTVVYSEITEPHLGRTGKTADGKSFDLGGNLGAIWAAIWAACSNRHQN